MRRKLLSRVALALALIIPACALAQGDGPRNWLPAPEGTGGAAAAATGGGIGLGSILSSVAGGGVGGAVLMAIIGMIKSAMKKA